MEYWGIIFIFLGLIILFQNINRDGIELYYNIFLGLIAIGILLFMIVNLFKQNEQVKPK